MANAAPVRLCRFIWDIYNPFVPWRRLAATFYHTSPYLTMWTVTFNPMDHHLDNWPFTISLKGVKYGALGDTIVADRIRVNISIDRTGMDYKEELNYSFCRENRHTYAIQTRVRSPPRWRSPFLRMEIEILFPSQNIAVEEGNGLFFHNIDLMQLSMDLDRLLTSGRHSDMKLRTKNTTDISSVHSCIMRARGCKFLEVHSADLAMGDAINTNISDNNLLSFVLKYAYTGKLDADIDRLPSEAFLTELFQVIDRYKIHHLYRNFVVDDSLQTRMTRRNRVSSSISFQLNDRHGQPLDNPSFEWKVNPNSKYEFTFKIKFVLDVRDPWFTYSLQSKTEDGARSADPELFTIHAQVNLELMHRSPTRSPDLRTAHECHYRVGSYEGIDSGTCHFEGDHPEFDDFLAGGGPANSQHFVKCTLCLSDGSIVIEIDSLADDEAPSNLERFNVLSDHVSDLMAEDTEKDLRFVCWPGICADDTFLLHKAIFSVRVPRWRHVIEEDPVSDAVPDVVTCRFGREAFRCILDYLYSGKVFPIPAHFLADVEGFAAIGGMWTLENLVNHTHT